MENRKISGVIASDSCGAPNSLRMATSIDGLLWLYSSEERGSYSRLAVRPLYSMEEDPTRNLLRRSILWPLGTYERRGDQAWAHVFPLYWHSEQPGREWTFTVPLYMKSIHGDSSWHHLFPLFSRHVMGEYYARNFVLGPLLITTRDSAHRPDSMGSPLSFLSLSTGSEFVEQLALPALLVRRRPIDGRSLSLYPAALRLLGRPIPTLQFPVSILWLCRQQLGPCHAIQPARLAACQRIYHDTLFSALRIRDDGR